MTTDLLTGNIPTPAYLNIQKFVDDAGDEIDSKVGFLYSTPLDVADTSAMVRPARLLIKRLNVFLATGRLLLAADAGGEENQIHAYGVSLLREANAALDAIASGAIVLDGAAQVPGSSVATVPVINNKDPESNVDAFYDRIANPRYLFPDLLPRYYSTNPEHGFVR